MKATIIIFNALGSKEQGLETKFIVIIIIVNRFLSVKQMKITFRDCFEHLNLAWPITSVKSSAGVFSS